ncbi:transposase [Sphingomonas lacusdianchii]|uniref:transposase n=1 Tax=Sphingomonas lacusdianchii TaxID=2917992 RepID=UPI003D66AC54
MSDEEWSLIGPPLPAERGRGCRPAGDNQAFFVGMMWIARTGVRWQIQQTMNPTPPENMRTPVNVLKTVQNRGLPGQSIVTIRCAIVHVPTADPDSHPAP